MGKQDQNTDRRYRDDRILSFYINQYIKKVNRAKLIKSQNFSMDSVATKLPIFYIC
jgi:hypothetical protein